jgi:hypothetical protein
MGDNNDNEQGRNLNEDNVQEQRPTKIFPCTGCDVAYVLVALFTASIVTLFTPTIISMWSSSSIEILSPTFDDDDVDVEAFSSQFGLTATIFSGFAFAFAILAIRIQGQEFVAQREKERTERKNAAKALAAQQRRETSERAIAVAQLIAQREKENKRFVSRLKKEARLREKESKRFAAQQEKETRQREKETKQREDEVKREKRERVFLLINEWNNLVQERTLINGVFDDADQKDVNICEMHHILFHTDDEKKRRDAEAVMKVLRFLGKWRKMETADLMDRDLMNDILPIDLNWWRSHVLPKLVADKEEPYCSKLVERINKHFDNLEERQRKGELLDEQERMGKDFISGFSKVKSVPDFVPEGCDMSFINVAADRQSLSWCLFFFLLVSQKLKSASFCNLTSKERLGKFKRKLLHLAQSIELAQNTNLKNWIKAIATRIDSLTDTEIIALPAKALTDTEIIALSAIAFGVSVTVVKRSDETGALRLEVTLYSHGDLLKLTRDGWDDYTNPTNPWNKRNMIYLYYKHDHYHLLCQSTFPNGHADEQQPDPPVEAIFLQL